MRGWLHSVRFRSRRTGSKCVLKDVATECVAADRVVGAVNGRRCADQCDDTGVLGRGDCVRWLRKPDVAGRNVLI